MVNAALFVLLALLGNKAPSEPSAQVLGEDHVHVQVAASREWLSPGEFISRARDHAKINDLPRGLLDRPARVWIRTEPGEVLAEVQFGGGIGQRILMVRLGRDGEVLDHAIHTGVDRVGVSPRVYEDELQQWIAQEAQIGEKLQAAREDRDVEAVANLERMLDLTQRMQEMVRQRLDSSREEMPESQR